MRYLKEHAKQTKGGNQLGFYFTNKDITLRETAGYSISLQNHCGSYSYPNYSFFAYFQSEKVP